MNRRQFNQAIAALGAIATLPAFARPTDVMAKPEIEQEKSLAQTSVWRAKAGKVATAPSAAIV